MLYTAIARPLLGAVIGYCTNYIAVKMLFRPFKPVKLFGHTLPFTPGIIPKEQGRVAKAVGRAVGGELLTQEELEQSLLSDETKRTVRTGVETWLERQKGQELPLGQLLERLMGETVYTTARETLYRETMDKVIEKVEELNLGTTVSAQVIAAVQEKVQGTLLAMMVNEEMLQSFAQPISDKIDDYVAVNGETMLAPVVCEELDHLEQRTVAGYLTAAQDSGVPLTDVILQVYELAVRKYLNPALRTVNLAGVVERKINSLEPAELETLVLSVMKKELSAVVNLGALIGFVLGLINLLF